MIQRKVLCRHALQETQSLDAPLSKTNTVVNRCNNYRRQRLHDNGSIAGEYGSASSVHRPHKGIDRIGGEYTRVKHSCAYSAEGNKLIRATILSVGHSCIWRAGKGDIGACAIANRTSARYGGRGRNTCLHHTAVNI